MSEQVPVMWLDLTVPDATRVRDFYQQVVGFRAEPLSMGDYDDYMMKQAETGQAVGVCHARGPNANLPPVWLPYFVVPDLDASMASVVAAGGQLKSEVRTAGPSRFVLVQDPAGAYSMLFQK